jgi:hypothetical protein
MLVPNKSSIGRPTVLTVPVENKLSTKSYCTVQYSTDSQNKNNTGVFQHAVGIGNSRYWK